MSAQNWDDQRIEVIIGALLRTGVILAAAVVLFGAVVYLARHGSEVPNYAVFRGEPENLKSASDIVHGALGMSGRAIIQLGLLLLIATPVARVLFSADSLRHRARLHVRRYHLGRAGDSVVQPLWMERVSSPSALAKDAATRYRRKPLALWHITHN